MNTIETLLDKLNNSDVQSNFEDIGTDLSCLENAESERDFRVNVNEAILSAEKLIKSLKDLLTGS